LQYDLFRDLGTDFNKWIAGHFEPFDKKDHQVDAIWLDIGGANMAPYPERVGDRYEHPGLKKWWDNGIDWIEELVKESQKRDLEVFWNHRIAEVDREENSLKKAHPDWVVKSWYYPGLWNLAVPEVRDYKVAFIKELIERYDFDGIQLDFARHVPCLPVGRQWELRDHVTEFVRMVRFMMLEMEKEQGCPLLLAVKVPKNLEGCRIDGFDVETWAQENLVDIFTLGTRSINVDIDAYRRITAGHNIKLQPCWDDYHSADAYKSPTHETLRGIFANWWQEGADGIMIFNWVANKFFTDYAKYDQDRLLSMVRESGNQEIMLRKDKNFVIERRGGYPWGEGFIGLNNDSPLPVTLANDGRPAKIKMKISDNLRANSDNIQQVTLSTIILAPERETK
jgi:hypothetical protein